VSAPVRKAEGLSEGDNVTVLMTPDMVKLKKM
jgi:hypothetical protein